MLTVFLSCSPATIAINKGSAIGVTDKFFNRLPFDCFSAMELKETSYKSPVAGPCLKWWNTDSGPES